jgi:RNA polymerase sigma-70 factor (ECF subfamily)
MEPNSNTEALVHAAAAGDRDALAKLLSVLKPKVIRYCRGRINSTQGTYASAEDVAQEVLMAVLAALPNYRGGGAGFEAFVYGIASNKVADFYRKKHREQTTVMAEPPEEIDPLPGPEQTVERHELRHKVDELLDTLPPGQREILVLRQIVGLSAEETANALSSTPGAVRVAQHRALTKLRRRIEECCGSH